VTSPVRVVAAGSVALGRRSLHTLSAHRSDGSNSTAPHRRLTGRQLMLSAPNRKKLRPREGRSTCQ
jgi:hypothetical protein